MTTSMLPVDQVVGFERQNGKKRKKLRPKRSNDRVKRLVHTTAKPTKGKNSVKGKKKIAWDHRHNVTDIRLM